MNHALVIALVLVSSPARADGALDEVAAGNVPATATAPGSRWLSDRFAAMWDVDTRWQLRLDLSGTRIYSGTADVDRGDVMLGSLAASYAPDEHWTLRLTGSWSPESTTRASVPVDAAGLFTGVMQADARVQATAWSAGAGIAVDYDTAGNADHELSVSASVTMTYFHSEQEVTGVDGGGQMLDPQGLRARCAATACSGELTGALWPQWVQLGQFAFGASVTDTVQRDTDLSLDATYFVYDADPLALGYYALATIGRSTLGSAAGVAPLRDQIAPSITHRWGNTSATASVPYGDSVDGLGFDLGASLRIQHKFVLDGSRRLKLFAKLAGSSHVDPNAGMTSSSSLGLGVQVTW